MRKLVSHVAFCILDRLANMPNTVAETVEDIAYFVQDADSGSPSSRVPSTYGTTCSAPTRLPRRTWHSLEIGRWAFVKNIDDARWLQMTAATLEVTLGRIDHQTSVANRLARVHATDDSCAIFIALLDNTDDTWDRPYIAGQAIDMLRAWQQTVRPVEHPAPRASPGPPSASTPSPAPLGLHQ